MFGIWGVLLGIPVYASAKVIISAIFEWYKVVSGLYELEERKSRVNNSQQMLQALEEQDLVKAEHYFVKALKNDPSDLLYDLANYLEGIGFLSSGQGNLPENCRRFPRG